MAKWGEFDFSQFEDMADRYKKMLNENAVEKWMQELLLELAYRAVAKIKKRTPVDTGVLRQRWDLGGIIRKGDGYEVEIFNNVEYAPYVEYGHRTGKDLTGWVEGRFMMTISMKEIEREMPKFLERKQTEFLNKLINGK